MEKQSITTPTKRSTVPTETGEQQFLTAGGSPCVGVRPDVGVGAATRAAQAEQDARHDDCPPLRALHDSSPPAAPTVCSRVVPHHWHAFRLRVTDFSSPPLVRSLLEDFSVT